MMPAGIHDFEGVGWNRGTSKPESFPVLEADEEAEVAIVGGGYTGLSAALHLAEAGRDVVLLETGEVGAGASGRNAGHVVPFWAQKTPADARRTFGRETADALNRLIARSAAEVFALVDRLNMACDRRPGGHLSLVSSEKALKRGRDFIAEWRDVGAVVRMLEPGEAGAFLDSPRVSGGWLFEDGGYINPLDYARGLAAGVNAAGGRIFARSAVAGISEGNGGWALATASGTIRARQLILATNAYEAGLWPGLGRAGYVIECAMLMSAPMADTTTFKWCGPWAWTDDKTVFGGAFTAAGALATSVFPGPGAITRDGLARVVDAKFARYLPRLGPLTWDSVWSGQLMLTPSGFPSLVKLADNGFAAFGYNGNGIAAATCFGRELAKAVTGAPDLCAPISTLKKAPLARLFPWIFRNMVTPVARAAGG